MTSIGITPEYEHEAEEFYTEVLKLLKDSELPFLIGGTYAVKHYTEIDRPTKDIDLFCKAGDYPKILKLFSETGFRVTVEDERWLARIYRDPYFVDIIFGSVPGMWPITDGWLDQAEKGNVLGFLVAMMPPEELIVSKAYRMKRGEFDGADIVHIMLKHGARLDWKRLLNRMEPAWELLYVYILLFRFTYPSQRGIVPKWLMEELITRIQAQLSLPIPQDHITRGTILSWEDYKIAVEKWGYKDMTEFTFPQR